jgi:hypothetical protein
MPPGASRPDLGRDPLDSLVRPGWLAGWLPRRRAALGLRASAAPALTFILVGVIIGPQGLDLLTTTAIFRLDPVVSVALAALGIFAGLGLGAMRTPSAPRLLLAASVEAAITIAVVSGVMYIFLTRWAMPLSIDAALFAAVVGICACASAATRPGDGTAREARYASRVVDMDDVPVVVLGTLVVSAAANTPLLTGTLFTAAAGVAVGVAGWLLFERARSEAERGVFVAGAVLLLGGTGAYLGTSPLLSGCAAALVWVRTPGRADLIIESDLRRLQHPLVALLLIVAGASIQWNLALLWIAAPLVMLRLIGKLLASTAAARLVRVPAGMLAIVLVPPGVLGVALALNVDQVLGTSDTLLLSGVTVATGISELIAMLLPHEPEESA